MMGGRGSNSNISASKPITEEQIKALEFYSDGNGRDINSYLRTGDDSSDVYGRKHGEDIAEYAEMMDGLLQKSSLPEATTVYRGAEVDEIASLMTGNDPSSLIGKTYQNKGLLSTTTDRSYAQSLANDSVEGVVFSINLKKGAKAMNIEPYVRNNEHEVLGATNTKFKISNAYRRNGILYVQMSGGK